MTRRGKALLLGFFAACVLATGAIYAWYEASLDQLADEQAPYSGPLLTQSTAPLRQAVPDRDAAEAAILALPEWDRDRVIDAVSRHPDKEYRLAAIGAARRVRDRPIPRAVLARLTLEDPDAKVKDAARKALNGEPP